MSQSMTRFLELLSSAFCNDALTELAQHFTYPLPLFAKGELLVFGTPQALVEALTIYRDATRKAGISRVSPRVIASGLPHNSYSNLWVEWDHYDRSDTLVGTSQVRYAICEHPSALTPKIELVDYTQHAFPEVPDALPLVQSA